MSFFVPAETSSESDRQPITGKFIFLSSYVQILTDFLTELKFKALVKREWYLMKVGSHESQHRISQALD